MPKQDAKVAWKVSELEKKFQALEGEVQVMRREAKVREKRISDLELRNTRLEDCVQQIATATKLTEENNASCSDGSSLKSPVSLKEDLLEILDCCLSHEERVTDVERKCEDNQQNIRYLLETGGQKTEESQATEEEKLDHNCNETPAPSSSSTTSPDGKMSQECEVTEVSNLDGVESGSEKEGGVPSDGQNHQLVLTLSSTGKSVLWKVSRNCLGQYLYHGDYNQAPAYHQRNPIKGTNRLYLFKSTDGSWSISTELGSEQMLMHSTSKTHSVPTTDWYGLSDGEWHQDPGLTVAPGIKPPCKSIIVLIRSKLKVTVEECNGVYIPTSLWYRGCPVYKHTHRTLFISKDGSWKITSGPVSGTVYLENNTGGLCPARGSWLDPMLSGRQIQDGDFKVLVQCDVHDAQ